MALEQYRKRRRFGVTSEPRGKTPRRRTRQLAYVIQKHRATAVHYDFRLEWKGVMLSWAVPKGPSLDPKDKRLAMPTEDHPLEYNKFEGIIPEGEYGGGTVMIWDRGVWSPEDPDVDAALAKGELKFRLDGEKLQGDWVLVRIRRRDGEAKTPWLLHQARRRSGGQALDHGRRAPLGRVRPPARRDRARRGRRHGEGRGRRSTGVAAQDARRSEAGQGSAQIAEESRLAFQPRVLSQGLTVSKTGRAGTAGIVAPEVPPWAVWLFSPRFFWRRSP